MPTANFGRWVGAFHAISAFNNSGMSLLDMNMVCTGAWNFLVIKAKLHRSRFSQHITS